MRIPSYASVNFTYKFGRYIATPEARSSTGPHRPGIDNIAGKSLRSGMRSVVKVGGAFSMSCSTGIKESSAPYTFARAL